MKAVYLDHAATTPLDERVLEAMKPYFTDIFANANSTHQLGSKAKVAVEEAREAVADMIGAEPAEIIFTSGGTESDNTAIKGVINATGKKEVITSPLEHHAVLHPVEMSKHKGVKPVYINPDKKGRIDPGKVRDAITENTAIVSIMHVNNEIGTINPIKEIAGVCKKKGVLFHSDTVQSICKLPIDVNVIGLDFLSISAHKIYGPKGIGVLYVRHGSPWMPWMHGGSQERRRRGGTLNVPGIVGVSKAMELCMPAMQKHRDHFRELREQVLNGLEQRLAGHYRVNGDIENGIPHILNISFTDENGNGLDGEMLLLNLDLEGICVSTGSACSSGAREPSHVLDSIGLDKDIANSSIRISMGKDNTKEEIEFFLNKLEKVINRMIKVHV